ncbi:hypothetical protein BDAP_000417 [Binucleata daphniae]
MVDNHNDNQNINQKSNELEKNNVENEAETTFSDEGIDRIYENNNKRNKNKICSKTKTSSIKVNENKIDSNKNVENISQDRNNTIEQNQVLDNTYNDVNDNNLVHKNIYNIHEQQKNKVIHTLNDYTISEPLLDNESVSTVNRSFISEKNDPLKHKECWICLSQEPNTFLCPCKCRGSTKFVHKQCFLDFIQSKKIENLKCSFCKADYILKSKYDSFLMVFDKVRKVNFYACQFIFIVYAVLLVYCILFLYGITVVLFFIGYDDLVKYISDYDSVLSYINVIRLAINVPIIPICILLSTHKKFSYVFHILPSLILFDSFDLKYFPFYFSPLLLFLYNKAISYIEKKYGKKNGEASILVNNHSFEVKIIINALLAPFIGVFVGEIFFFGAKKRSLRSFYGCVCYTLIKDFFSIYYLISARKRIRTLEIGEYQ